MRHLVLAIALTAFGGASHAAANVPGYNCQGYAEDPVAGSVTVDLHLDANGAPGAVISSWMPPAQASALIKGAPVYDAALMIGDGGEALLTISALARPGARSTPKALYRDLDALRITVGVDAGAPRPLAYANDIAADDLPLTASRSARLTLPAGTRTVEVQLRDAKGRLVRSARFDLSDRAAHQRLTAAAQDEARRAATDYKTCLKLG